jgi:hypothetical protein
MWLRSTALVLAFALTPIGSEVVEVAVHLIAHGDLSHYSGPEKPVGDEHGCSALSHSCACGHGSGVPSSAKPSDDARAGDASRSEFSPPPDVHGRAPTAPPHPPPIA